MTNLPLPVTVDRRQPACAAALLAFVLAVTSSCGAKVPSVDVGERTQAIPRAVSVARINPLTAETEALAAPTDTLSVPAAPVLVAYPRVENPLPGPQSMPAEEVQCRRELKSLGVSFRNVEPIHQGACGIDYPVQVSAIGSVQMKPAATLTCAMAETFSRWTKKELVPASRWRYLSGIRSIRQGSSYSCRNIAGEGVLSEHGKGNALDVMALELNNGTVIDVRKKSIFSFRQRGLLNTVRKDGCEYFNTVLGPGYNKDHANHFHFDIKHRRNNYVACR